MFDLLWNMYQDQRLLDASFEAGMAKDAATDARSLAQGVQRQLDSLLLVNMAMWSILEEKLGVTEAQLAERVREIDLRNGKLDGRYAPEGVECPKCHRIMSVRHKRCMYCGAGSLTTRVF
jgi:hypothetical protein